MGRMFGSLYASLVVLVLLLLAAIATIMIVVFRR